MSKSTETHSYDGHLGPIYLKLKAKDSRELPTFVESLEIIGQWLHQCGLNANEKRLVQASLNLIKNDKKQNMDHKNQIHVEDLLPRAVATVSTWESSGRDVFLKTFSEIKQLGPCAQGRTTRLMQFYKLDFGKNVNSTVSIT